MSIIETKEQLDMCKTVSDFASDGAFKVDSLKLISSFHEVDLEDFRRANVVLNYRLNNGLTTNPYKETDSMFKVYELLLSHNRETYQQKLLDFLQFDINPLKFSYVNFYKKDSKDIISAYKEVELNLELYPEALIK